jgi:diguanylate cyclase (GGDEF)-like protein/PAS domain S-box-containing protein
MRVLTRLSNWLGSLSVGRKLTLIYLLDLTAVIYISGILIHEKYLAINFARQEVVGVTYTTAVRDVLMRSLTPDNARQAAPDLARDEALRRLRDVQQSSDSVLGTASDSIAFSQSLARFDAEPAPGPQALGNLIQSARTLMTSVGNQSNLILDPDLDSYYTMSLVVLRFPELVEVLNDTMQAIRAKARVVGNESAQSTALLIVAGRLDAVSQGIRADYKQAYAAGGASLQAAMMPSQTVLDAQLAELLVQVQQLAYREVTVQDLQAARLGYQQALSHLDAAWLAGGNTLEQLLDARVDALFARMWLHLGTALLLLLSILSLVVVVARLISKPLKRLALVADDVRRTGDHSHRAHWDSQDEIGQLVTAFNGMLAQLDHERVVQQETAASTRAAQAQQALVESIPIPMVVTSVPEHRVLHANAPAQPWLGGRLTDPWRAGMEPGVRARFFQRLADRGVVDEFEVRWLGGAEPSWAVLSARRLSFQGQDAVLTTFTPINVLKVMEQRLELWAKVFEASSEGIVIMDAQQRILSVNHAFCRATAYDYYDVIGEPLGMMLDEDPGPAGESLVRQIRADLEQRDAWQGEVRFRKQSGDTYPAWLMISAVRESAKQGDVSHYIGISIDITDRKRTEARVQFLAHHDVLTELPNRSLCIDRLRAALLEAQATGQCVAVLFIDLDRFKTINDTLGHHVGDGLLRSVAERLNLAVRTGDTVSRLGGDEFVVILREVVNREEASSIVEQRLIPLIRQTHHVETHELQVSCSVGIAVYPEDGLDLDELMRRADAAMYEAKSSGRDKARMFEVEIDVAVRERQTLERNLRQAVERGELRLHYQPRLDAKTLRMVGVEALLRWQSAELGPVSPARFIPLAEETGLIRPIGLWVMQEACAQWARWRDAGWTDIVMSINLSAAQLSDPELVTQLRGCIERFGCDPAYLELEITESHLMGDTLAAERQLAALKGLGLALSVDDFGTGYSSLAYLKRFTIDKLKIDQSFVRDMLTDPTDLAIIRAIIALGHILGLGVVAEGVELPEHVEQLRLLGCDELQGYHFARPMAEEALAHWLQAHRGGPERRRLGLVAAGLVPGNL